jgi:hypothetical protein
MSLLTFSVPVLTALDDGHIIRRAVSMVLRILGVLTVLAGIFAAIAILKESFRLPTEGTVGGLILAVVFAAAIAAIVQVLFYRARGIEKLEPSLFTVIPLSGILLRTLGEIYATLSVAIGVGGCIFIWLSGFSPLRFFGVVRGLFPSIATDGTFLGGVFFLVNFALVGFFGLLFFHLLSESVIVLADIAIHVRMVARQPTVTGLSREPAGLAGSSRSPTP